jgi:hypothetical protein
MHIVQFQFAEIEIHAKLLFIHLIPALSLWIYSCIGLFTLCRRLFNQVLVA